jgi:RNase P subunit RPR2
MPKGCEQLKDDRIEEVLTYCNDHGETETCTQFNINIETLHRYMRERRFRDTRQLKILLLDIETARMIFGGWRLGKQRVGPDQVVKDWFILGWSCKWLYSADVLSDFVTAKEAILRDDKRVCKSLWKLVNDADIIISHNGEMFDLPKINWRFLINGLQPPMPYRSIDTWKHTKNLGASSRALNFLGKMILNKEKLHTDYQLWISCEEGDQDALDQMETYCKGDVSLLEDVYLEVRGWIKSHPNVAILMDAYEQCCPTCGSFEFEEGEGYYTTPQNKYVSIRCSRCGSVNRKKASEITKEQRKVMLVPNAR